MSRRPVVRRALGMVAVLVAGVAGIAGQVALVPSSAAAATGPGGGGVAVPDPYGGSILQAESMVRPSPSYAKVVPATSAGGGAYLELTRNETVTGTIDVWPDTRNLLEIRARGDQYLGAPKLQVRVDGAVLVTITVPQTTWTTFPVEVPLGHHTLALAFLNDRYDPATASSPGGDRNLRIDQVSVLGAASGANGLDEKAEWSLLNLANAERAAVGAPPLTFAACAVPFAHTWATHLGETTDFSHQALGPILSACDARTAGENIAAGARSPEDLMALWMSSPGHRANILNPAFTRAGFGAYRTPDGRLAGVQDFVG